MSNFVFQNYRGLLANIGTLADGQLYWAEDTDTLYIGTAASGNVIIAAHSASVSSVFGRTGAVTAQSGDYTVAEVTGAAPLASPTFTGTVVIPNQLNQNTTGSSGSCTGNSATATTATNLAGTTPYEIPYQSASGTTGYVSPNVTGSTDEVLTSTSLFGSAQAPTLKNAPALSATNMTSFPTLNQNTTGSSASLSVSGQTGLISLTGITSTNRIKTVRDAADTLLELGGSYTPTGTWTSLTLAAPVLGTPASGTLTNCTFPTLNQNTTGTSGGLAANATIDGIATVTIPTAPIIYAQAANAPFGTFNTGSAVTMLASTGTPAGFYRVTFNLVVTTTFVTNTAITLAFGWTDKQAARTLTLTGAALTAGTQLPAFSGTAVAPTDFSFYSTGTAAITYTPAKTGTAATAGAAWIAVTLERLA